SLGAAIQLATTIKDHESITDLKQLYAAAGELKIPRSLAKEALQKLEELNFVRLKYATGKNEITRIDITVPDSQRVYRDFGEFFLSENKSDLSLKTLQLLEKLSDMPFKESEIISSLGISSDVYDQLKDVGKAASLIDTYVSPTDSKSIIFSPLYWEDNPAKIFDLLKKHNSDSFLKSIDTIK